MKYFQFYTMNSRHKFSSLQKSFQKFTSPDEIYDILSSIFMFLSNVFDTTILPQTHVRCFMSETFAACSLKMIGFMHMCLKLIKWNRWQSRGWLGKASIGKYFTLKHGLLLKKYSCYPKKIVSFIPINNWMKINKYFFYISINSHIQYKLN